MKLPEDIASCHILILQQAEQIKLLSAQLSELINRQEVLEGRLKENSRNSNRHPSSDGFTKRPALARVPKGKKGGQKGHKGDTLKMVDTPDMVVEVYPSVCTCGADLTGTAHIIQEKRQVFDLPPQRLQVTEYRQLGGYCPCCAKYQCLPFPKEIVAPVQYGSGVKALCVLLANEYRTPFRKIGQLFKDIYGQSINSATVSSFMEDCHRRLADEEAYIRKQLSQEAVAHFDETGIRCSGTLHWLHTASSSLYTLLFVHAKRGIEAFESSSSVLKDFKGWAVHDCWNSYFKVGLQKHAICQAHIIRELVGLSERGSRWAPHMERLLWTLYKMTDSGRSALDEQQLKKARKVYRCILSYADSLEPPPVKKGRGQFKSTKGRNLLNRLSKLESAMLAFAHHPEVPFTNNQAERDLRPAKVKLKIAGTFRAISGANEYARIQSFISTLQKHQFDVFTQLMAVFQGQKILIGS